MDGLLLIAEVDPLGRDQLELPAGQKAEVKDLWGKKVPKDARGGYGVTVAPHGVIMLRITPARRVPATTATKAQTQ